MERDVRGTPLWHQVEEHFRRWLEPAFGEAIDAVDAALSPDGERVAVTATVYERLEGRGLSRIAVADADGVRLVTAGPHDDRLPAWSPDGMTVAFLSDRAEQGVFALYLLRAGDVGEALPTPAVDGIVEYLQWSPDGSAILLGVAGRGADLGGAQGSGTTAAATQDAPAWLPWLDAGPTDQHWRRLWVYDIAGDTVTRISPDDLNVWEAAWCGPDAFVAVCSPGVPTEDAWYMADVRVLGREGGHGEILLDQPGVQFGLLGASPQGTRVAVVEGRFSDRGVTAGDVRLVDVATRTSQLVDTLGVDVARGGWLDELRFGFIGVRGLDTVAGVHALDDDKPAETWSTSRTTGARYPEASWLPDGRFAAVVHGYGHPPAIAIVEGGELRVLATLRSPGSDYLTAVGGTVQEVSWPAPDGLQIQGLLCTPDADGPHPLVVAVHGGPSWLWRNRWRMGYHDTPLLVSRGYAVLHPNPRGSSGRGNDFRDAVIGDMGGADAADILAGVDAMVERGIADPHRLAVMGGSYGGFMSSWLVTQDQRFAAAVPMAPVTNWYSEHFTANIGVFDAMFLADDVRHPGEYHARSPVVHAHAARTPTLVVAGQDDRCTPPGQALEFATALRLAGVESACALYPGEGHGIRSFPAVIDLWTRVLGWFQQHL